MHARAAGFKVPAAGTTAARLDVLTDLRSWRFLSCYGPRLTRDRGRPEERPAQSSISWIYSEGCFARAAANRDLQQALAD
jgi:hypothetical protein